MPLKLPGASSCLRDVVERSLVELVVEAAPVWAVADLRPHQRLPRVASAGLVPRRDQDTTRQGVKRQRPGHSFERIAARRAFGEVVDAKTGSAGLRA